MGSYEDGNGWRHLEIITVFFYIFFQMSQVSKSTYVSLPAFCQKLYVHESQLTFLWSHYPIDITIRSWPDLFVEARLRREHFRTDKKHFNTPRLITVWLLFYFRPIFTCKKTIFLSTRTKHRECQCYQLRQCQYFEVKFTRYPPQHT